MIYTKKNMVNKKEFDSLYLMLLLLVSSLRLNKLLTVLLIVYIAINIIKNNYKISKKILNSIILPLLIIFISLKGIFIYDLKDSLRDIYFFVNPILVIISGHYFIKNIGSVEEIIDNIYIVASLFSIYHIVQVIPYILSGMSIYSIRYINSGYHIVTIALAIMITTNRYDKNKLYRNIRILILLLSTVISFSRTAIIVIFIIIFITKLYNCNFKNTTIKLLKLFLIIIALGILCYSAYYLFDIKKSIDLDKMIMIFKEYFEKIISSINEVKAQNYNTMYDINHNWRGYEAYRANLEFQESNLVQKFFGYGSGKRIDLGMNMQLGGSYFTSIPHTHNGYSFLLVKTGIIGLIVYIIMSFTWIKSIISNSLDRYEISLGISLVCIIMVLTYVINGIYSESMLFIYLLLLSVFMSKVKIIK